VSNRQFWHKAFVPQLEATLLETGLDPSTLRLEITEGVIMHNPELADTVMRRLHRLGISLHIDDFGTGYSSLEALHRFPIDALKIDRSFVARLAADRRSAKIVRTIVLLGQDLEVDVIAEGVETALQAQQLGELGCLYAQGHWYAPAVPAEEALRMLREWRPATEVPS
jgi:EAL domain-containing protein (putative c-di-GMP-specific phosphodiesterase class I)